jgi:uncharacterized protein (UPF0335 family)
LIEKVEKLNEEKRRTGTKRDSVDTEIRNACGSLNNKRTILAVREKEYAELQEQVKELSELIAQERQ